MGIGRRPSSSKAFVHFHDWPRNRHKTYLRNHHVRSGQITRGFGFGYCPAAFGGKFVGYSRQMLTFMSAPALRECGKLVLYPFRSVDHETQEGIPKTEFQQAWMDCWVPHFVRMEFPMSIEQSDQYPLEIVQHGMMPLRLWVHCRIFWIFPTTADSQAKPG